MTSKEMRRLKRDIIHASTAAVNKVFRTLPKGPLTPEQSAEQVKRIHDIGHAEYFKLTGKKL